MKAACCACCAPAWARWRRQPRCTTWASGPAACGKTESLDFAQRGQVHATVATDRLENINAVFERMHKGQIEGRIVLDLAA
ncbi:hypothetical protein ACV4V2_32330 [Pseudomonas aeruginosa]